MSVAAVLQTAPVQPDLAAVKTKYDPEGLFVRPRPERAAEIFGAEAAQHLTDPEPA